MKINHTDYKKRIVKVTVQDLDDLWFLHGIIEKDDFVSGKTERKLRLGDSQQAVRKTVFLKIKVNRVEFSKHSPILRVGGPIAEAPEEIALDDHHTFNIEQNTTIAITKREWLAFHKQRLQESTKPRSAPLLILVMDREEAIFAVVKQYGYDVLSHVKGDVVKKQMESTVKKNFYETLAENLQEYVTRFNSMRIVVASPAFFKDEFVKKVNDDKLKKKIILATCHSVSRGGISEVLKRPEVHAAVKDERIFHEMTIVDELFEHLSKDKLATYGIQEVEAAANAGAIEKLLVTNHLIQTSRENDTFSQLETIMKLVEQNRGHVTIISSENDAGKKIDGVSGIAAVLRYPLN